MPLKLKVHVGPPQILADRGVYDSILVQLVDSKGYPARAEEDIIVSLSSSKTYIGSVDQTCIIPAGYTYALANFFSTYTPGSTTITAFASGFPSEQASITTVGPIPSKLAVYCFPQLLPADGKIFDAVIVQLQDSAGNPARAPIGDTEVILSSSKLEIGKIDSSLTIESGHTYAIAKFQTTTTPGSSTITAVSPGYMTGQTNVITSELGNIPYKLKVDVGPPKITAEGLVHESISVQLQDTGGKLAKAIGDLDVTLTSSNIAVGNVESTVTIRSGKTHAITTFNSTYRSGATTITAVASGYMAGQTSISTVGPIPSKIAIYGFPPVVTADNDEYSIILQLQDSAGMPARDPIGNVTIKLSSSDTEIGNVNSTAVIPFGYTYSKTEFYSSDVGGSVTITAVAPDYTSGKLKLSTLVIDPTLSVSVTADPPLIQGGGQTTVTVYLTHDSANPNPPVPGATVEFTSDKGGSFSPVTDEENGYYTAVFTAPQVDEETIYTIKASASKFRFFNATAQTFLNIKPFTVGGDVEKPTFGLNFDLRETLTKPFVLISIGGIVAVAMIIIVLIKR